jgi:hypothetical protein
VQPTVGTQGAAPATPPTVSFITNPGITTAAINAGGGGTGYNTVQVPNITTSVVPLVGSCVTNPTVTVAAGNINNVGGNLTGLTLTNSGQGCLPGTTFTTTIDPGGITNINFPAGAGSNGGTQYLGNGSGTLTSTSVPSITLAPPTPTPAAGHCNVTATATATVTNGVITAITIQNPGCGYPAGDNPAITIGAPGVTLTGLPSGSGYTANAALLATLPVGFAATCSVPPVLSTVSVTAVGVVAPGATALQ